MRNTRMEPMFSALALADMFGRAGSKWDCGTEDRIFTIHVHPPIDASSVTEPLNGSATTLLRISGVGMSVYAARGLTQTLNPIDQSKDLRRTINGELIDLSVEQFRKYASVISGNDQMPPGVAGIWPGRDVQIECIAELYYV